MKSEKLIIPPKHFEPLKKFQLVEVNKTTKILTDKDLIKDFIDTRCNVLVKEMLDFSGKIIKLSPMSTKDISLGYEPSKKEILIAFEIPTIEHEFAHMLELTDLNRLTKIDFGFKNSNFSTLSANRKIKAAVMEIRTRAIQSRITDQVFCLHSNKFIMKDIVSILPFGKLKSVDDFKLWESNIWSSTYDMWTIDKIKLEWQNRMNFIQNWMNS